MGTEGVQHDPEPGIADGVTVAGDVRSALEHLDTVSFFSQFARDHRARQASPRYSDPHRPCFPYPCAP
jgi:hypothetical protein